jgi:hypothetical protein
METCIFRSKFTMWPDTAILRSVAIRNTPHALNDVLKQQHRHTVMLLKGWNQVVCVNVTVFKMPIVSLFLLKHWLQD